MLKIEGMDWAPEEGTTWCDGLADRRRIDRRIQSHPPGRRDLRQPRDHQRRAGAQVLLFHPPRHQVGGGFGGTGFDWHCFPCFTQHDTTHVVPLAPRLLPPRAKDKVTSGTDIIGNRVRVKVVKNKVRELHTPFFCSQRALLHSHNQHPPHPHLHPPTPPSHPTPGRPPL